MALLPTEHTHLSRISTTLSTTFLAFRLATWHTHIRDAHTSGPQIMLYLSATKPFRRHGWWSMFPLHIVGLDDVENKNAVLTTMSVLDIGHFTRVVGQMFEGLNFHLEELSLRILPPSRRTLLRSANASFDFNDYDFWVLRATSRTSAHQYAIHPAGAQYGIHSAGSAWHDFADAHVYKILGVHAFGTLARYAARMSSTKGVAGLEFDVQAQAMAAWHGAVDPAMAKKGLTWRDVLGKSEADFARHVAKILARGNRAVEVFVRDARLTKRRVKAERYEKRHGEALGEEKRGIDREVFGYEDVPREFEVEGMVIRLSRHEQPGLEVLKERCGWDMEGARDWMREEEGGGDEEEMADD